MFFFVISIKKLRVLLSTVFMFPTLFIIYFQVVNILYRENDWVYVIACDSRQEGFIPHSYCTPFNSQLGELAMSNVKKKLPRTSSEPNEEPIIDTRPGKIFKVIFLFVEYSFTAYVNFILCLFICNN